MTRRYGLLLLHASVALLREGFAAAEELDFDSIFVRDHLVYEPHPETDGIDAKFCDPLLSLTAAASGTTS